MRTRLQSMAILLLPLVIAGAMLIVAALVGKRRVETKLTGPYDSSDSVNVSWATWHIRKRDIAGKMHNGLSYDYLVQSTWLGDGGKPRSSAYHIIFDVVPRFGAISFLDDVP